MKSTLSTYIYMCKIVLEITKQSLLCFICSISLKTWIFALPIVLLEVSRCNHLDKNIIYDVNTFLSITCAHFLITNETPK